VKEEWAYQVHSLKPNGQWLKFIDELPERPAGTKKIPDPRGGKDRGGKDRTVWRTPEGHDVSTVLYLGLMRRIEGELDPAVYWIKFQSGDLSTYFKWRDEALALTGPKGQPLPLWGAFWRWFIIMVPGRREGEEYANWAFKLIARCGDGSPEAPTGAEYRLAQAIFKGEAKPQTGGRAAPAPKAFNETKGAAPGKRDNVPAYDNNGAPPYDLPPVSVYDDLGDIPF
jgi:hypothetical protein